jgi:parvulin-like peptidyl-prolyl isomerase
MRAQGKGLRAAVAALLLLAATVAAAETIDRVLAVVAGQLIMLSDVNAVRDLGIVKVRADSPDPTADVLASLIDRELMLAEVDRYAPPEPDPADIDRDVATVRARFSTQKAFDDVLARSGFDTMHVRELVRQNLRLKAYLDQRFAIAGTDESRRQMLIDDWVAGLRRRTPAVDLYKK